MNSTRYISLSSFPSPPNASQIRSDVSLARTDCIQRVEKHAPDHKDHPSVYVGISGIALMNWHLATASLPSLSFSSYDPLQTCSKQLSTALSSSRLSVPRTGARAAFLETTIGTATVVLRIAIQDTDSAFGREVWQPCVQLLEGAVKASLREDAGEIPEDGCEVLYGRAGLLYALLLLHSASKACSGLKSGIQAAVEPLVADDTIASVIDDIVRRGKEGAREYAEDVRSRLSAAPPALMWSWYGKRYLGGAHGVAGIVQMLVSSPIHLIEPHLQAILNTVQWLIDVQDQDGNWPSKAPTGHHASAEELVQWCHGATGPIILLSTLLRRPSLNTRLPTSLKSPAHSALASGADLVYRHGLLRKGVGLSHGVGGSVYALLAASRALNSEGDYLGKAAHLAWIATNWYQLIEDGQMSLADRPYSLYEGLAGMCCAWADVLRRLDGVEAIGMPGYDDLEIEDPQ